MELETLERIEKKLDRLLRSQTLLIRGVITMSDAINAALAQLSADFDAETNAVASRLDKLAADLAAAMAANAPVDPATLAALQATSARLKTLGADPAAPIPPAPPAP